MDVGHSQRYNGGTGRRYTGGTSTGCLLFFLNWTSQWRSWTVNSRTTTSVDCHWINASVTRVVDHLRLDGFVTSHWTAAWIARRCISDSVAIMVNKYGELPTTALHGHSTRHDGTGRQSLDQRFSDKRHRPSVSEPRHHKAIIESQDNGPGLQLPMTATTSSGQQTGAVCRCNSSLQWISSLTKSRQGDVSQRRRLDFRGATTFVDQWIGWRPTTEHGQGKQDGCGFKDCGTRHSSKHPQWNRFYGVETCDPERTTGFQRSG